MNRELSDIWGQHDPLDKNLLNFCMEFCNLNDIEEYYDSRTQQEPENILTFLRGNFVFKIAEGKSAIRLNEYIARSQFIEAILKDFSIPLLREYRHFGKRLVMVSKKVEGKVLNRFDKMSFKSILKAYLDLTRQLVDSSEQGNELRIPERFSQVQEYATSSDQLVFNIDRKYLLWPKLELCNLVFTPEKKIGFLNVDKIGFFSELEIVRQIARCIQCDFARISEDDYQNILKKTIETLPEIFSDTEELNKKIIYFCQNSHRLNYEVGLLKPQVLDLISSFQNA